MSCDNVREQLEFLWEAEPPGEVRQHLSQCPSCSAYRRDLQMVRSGLSLWKLEAPVEPSLGFAERLVRQLADMSRTVSAVDFFERVGRRFVYASLVLTFLALLALALPSQGPVRGLTAADIQITAQEASLAYGDPMGENTAQESPDLAAPQASQPAVGSEVK